jgi:hypothetical protein
MLSSNFAASGVYRSDQLFLAPPGYDDGVTQNEVDRVRLACFIKGGMSNVPHFTLASKSRGVVHRLCSGLDQVNGIYYLYGCSKGVGVYLNGICTVRKAGVFGICPWNVKKKVGLNLLT